MAKIGRDFSLNLTTWPTVEKTGRLNHYLQTLDQKVKNQIQENFPNPSKNSIENEQRIVRIRFLSLLYLSLLAG